MTLDPWTSSEPAELPIGGRAALLLTAVGVTAGVLAVGAAVAGASWAHWLRARLLNTLGNRT